MPRGHIPYRGEAWPRQYGSPSPPNPNEKSVTALLIFLFITTGFVILYFAVTLALEGNFGGIFVFVIYAMFALIAFFAMKDLKNIETITPDIDNEPERDDEDISSLAEDYFAEIEWMHTHQQGDLASRQNTPEPQRTYRIARTRGNKILERDAVFVYMTVLGMCAAIGIGYLFGADSPITIGITIIGGLIFLLAYLVRT